MRKGAWPQMLIQQTQEYRQASVTTPLGQDAVLLDRLVCEERLSEPFSIVVHVISENGEVDFLPHLGAGIGVSMMENQAVSRMFHGVLWEARTVGENAQGLVYRLLLRPWTALLSLGMNSRIFQNKSVLDIAKDVFTEAGFSRFDFSRLRGGYKPREYCVQFRESDFAFFSRLLEEEGIYYFFQHDEQGHTLVLADDPGSHEFGVHTASVPYIRPGAERARRQAHLTTWNERLSTAPQRMSLRDFHFARSAERFDSSDEASPEYENDKAELYDYPGGYTVYGEGPSNAEGRRYAAARLEAARAERRKFTGAGDAFGLACGTRFSLAEHHHAPFNRDYLLLATTHQLSAESYRAGGGQGYQLDVSVEAIPSDTPWRPTLKSPKPVAGGPQTATVTGPAGEVIHVDKFGRVKVQFHWDRLGKFDDKTSCWIRVSQAWADTAFGTMMIPRIGEEVVVDFIDGDPDAPLITGRVYNNLRTVPYALPGDKTKSTWKSRTVGKSGAYDEAEEPPKTDQAGFNELRFDDKGGAEEVYMHAQRDYNGWVRLDESHKTGRDLKRRVGRDRRTDVKRHQTTIVETGDETRQVKKGSRKSRINKDDELTVETGDYTVKVSKGKALIEAKQEILLKVGSNTVRISPQGVEIKGLTITAKADTSLSAKALTAEVKASTMLTLNGLPVMIN
jgi:type VI secretion system secreted protein VgrG